MRLSTLYLASDLDQAKEIAVAAALDDLKYKRLDEWFKFFAETIRYGDVVGGDSLRLLAEMKARRDVLEHSAGVANDLYVNKVTRAGATPRYAAGERVVITDDDFQETADLIRKVLGVLATLAADQAERGQPVSDPAAPILKGVDRLVIRVNSVAAAVAYYRDVLNLPVVREGQSFATLQLGDGREVLLHNDADLPEEAVFLLVEDVRDLYKRREELRLKFAGPPGRVSRGYKATVKDPFGTVLLLIDRTLDAAGDAAASPEIAKTPDALFAGVPAKLQPKRDVLAGLYEQAGRTADDLPYTPQFERIHADYAATFPEPQPARGETWRHLLTLRKKGELPKLGAARSRPPTADPKTVALLRQVLQSEFGGEIGRRDRLPYSPAFDAIADAFNRRRVRAGDDPLAPHPLWRLVALLAK